MLRSMTGFGEANTDQDGVHLHVEIRSLNNRFFKALIRMPEAIQGLEPEVDSLLRRRLARGSISITVRYTDTTADAAYSINIKALQSYMDGLGELPHNLGHPFDIDVAALLHLPGVLNPPDRLDKQVDTYRSIVLELVNQACDAVIERRRTEGAALKKDLHAQREVIERKLALITERAPIVVAEYRARLQQRVENMLAQSELQLNQDDLVREVAIFADKSDINEELTRLAAHLTQFHELIDSKSGEPVGRTLDFLAQELLREANTIASKSNDAEISREIVEIKGAIDRIKEQVQNIE
ncbi:MAG: YicC family protein [Planctomycetes bacterium]|nr:YicC family protein [Planctomycetota bacterium]NOG54748.1 YicC family protein [Planctomycetota bacterium]